MNPKENVAEASFGELLEAYESGRARGVPPDQARKGIIAAVSGERVFVDIGGKSEGVIPITEFSEPVHPGQEIQVTIAGWHVGRRSA